VYFLKFSMKQSRQLIPLHEIRVPIRPCVARIEDDRIDIAEGFWDMESEGIGGIEFALTDRSVKDRIDATRGYL
jgi:hypothetical protein